MNLTIANASEQLITHYSESNKFFDLHKHENIIKNKKNLSLPVETELKLLKELSEFDLGRFLLINKGLNGYWTSYIILHGPKKQLLHHLEKWILFSAPVVKATQERFSIFKKLLQTNLKDNITVASIPCGIMDDLINLNTKDFNNITFVGIDLDHKSISLAKKNSTSNLNANFDFHKKDAWNLHVNNKYDIITSNGLNIYEPDDDKVVMLYKNFYSALKPNGLLITSFLTPPLTISKESTWKNYNQEDLIKQKAIFGDIIGVSWQSFRTEEQTVNQLKQVGFSDIKVIYDSQGMFPTVMAKKHE